MLDASQSFELILEQLARLTAPDVLGFYTHFEATEIFAVREGEDVPHNVLSILVAEEHAEPPLLEPRYLGSRIRLVGMRNWGFCGIKQTIRPIDELRTAFGTYARTKEWCVSGARLTVGGLAPLPARFIPPDSTSIVPLNRILKNNFWNGSYVLELMDVTKTVLQPLFDEPPRLQELSYAIRRQLPLGLASLSDRLGNVVVQLPITAHVATFAKNRVTGEAIVNCAWHSQSKPRPIRASCEMRYDNAITAYASADIKDATNSLPTEDGQGMQRGVLWDDENQVVLAATGDTGFIETVVYQMGLLDPEPRVFSLRDSHGNEQAVRVGLMTGSEHAVGGPTINRGKEWTQRRIYREEASRLAAQRRFVQYKPQQGREHETHEKALDDLRELLRLHGRQGAWLWDPYLSADDVLRTLFYAPHSNAELRALTAGYEPHASATGRSFADTQRDVFAAAQSNLRSLRLEFRMKSGTAGWAFHDRFLIFPNTNAGTLAWSLGTSINSVGRQHHILQQVDDGQLIATAFEELWDELDEPEHLVWRAP